MNGKNNFWSKQKSQKTDETMICAKCNGIQIKQTSTIGMIFVVFVILMFIPVVQVFGFIGFGIFALLVLSGYRPVMRNCLKCKAKGDDIIPVSSVKGKMLFETYHDGKVADVKGAEGEGKTKKKGKIIWKMAIYSIIGMIAVVVIGPINAPTNNNSVSTQNDTKASIEEVSNDDGGEEDWKPSEKDVKFCNEAKKELCGLYKEILGFLKTKDFQEYGYNGSDTTKYQAWYTKVINGANKYDNSASAVCSNIWHLEHTRIYFSELYTISINMRGNSDEIMKFKKRDSNLSTGFSANFKKVCGVGLFE